MGRPKATVDCNECNEALDLARDAVAMARRLALVAQNALLNGDLRRVRSILQDLQDAASSDDTGTAATARGGQ